MKLDESVGEKYVVGPDGTGGVRACPGGSVAEAEARDDVADAAVLDGEVDAVSELVLPSGAVDEGCGDAWSFVHAATPARQLVAASNNPAPPSLKGADADVRRMAPCNHVETCPRLR